MAIDLGDIPTGTPPSPAEKLQIRSAIGVGTTDVPTFSSSYVIGLTSIFRALTGTGFSSEFGAGALALHSTAQIAWASSFNGFGTKDLALERDAAGILAQRNGSAKQALRVYNTALSGAPEWAEFDWITSGGTNTLRIGTNLSGTGAARPIEFVTGGVARMSIGAAGGVIVEANLGIEFASNARIASQASGNIRLSNNSATDFNRLQLGGTTSAFPAIKRNGTGIDIKLADDSAFAPLTAASLSVGSATITTAIGIGSAQIRAVSNNKLRFINNTLDNFTAIELGEADMGIMRGAGTPEGAVTAKVGSIFLRTDGGAGTSFYVKESSPTPSTGWVAK